MRDVAVTGVKACILLIANDTVTCTFTDTKRGQIVVDKVTSPSGDPTSFSFSTTGTGYASFILTDPATPNGQTLSPGAYSVSAHALAGWVLTVLSCVSSTGTTTFTTFFLMIRRPPRSTLFPLHDALPILTCTFTDTKRGQIVVDKVTSPSGDPTSFSFSTT